MSARTKSTAAKGNYGNTLSPSDVDLNMSRLSGLSHGSGSSVVLGGTQYPVGSRIGSSGMFVIADPMTDFNPRGPDSLYGSNPETSSLGTGSLSTSFMQVKGAYPIRERGYGFEDWNWTVIRYICLIVVFAVMVILLAATIGLTVQHNKDCNILFEWWEGSSVYRIQVPLFRDSNSDGIGDLKGVESKISYLTYLGVDMVLLSDFLTASTPFYNNLNNFQDVDRRVGKINDFISMVRTFHDNDIRVLMELPLVTTSTDHVWFLESREQSAIAGNNFKDFYFWEELPTDALNASKWKADPIRSQYYYHRNDISRPVLNWKDAELRNGIDQVMKYWMGRGVDGFLIQGVKDFYADSQSDISDILSRMRDTLNDYPSKKLLIVEGDYMEKVSRTNPELMENINRYVDGVEMPIMITINTTYKMQWDIQQGLKWQRKPGGPQTLWKIKHYTSIEQDYVAAVQMYLAMLPGNPSFQAGDEVGVHYDILEDEKFQSLLWQSANVYPHLPGSKLNSTTINSLRDVLLERHKSYALRKDNNGKKTPDGDKVINLKFLSIDPETMLLERYFRREDAFYYAANMAKKKTERDWAGKVPNGDMVADVRGEMSGFIRLESMKLHPAQSVVFKVIH